MDVMALGVQIRSSGGHAVLRDLRAVDTAGRNTARTFGGVSSVLANVGRDFAVTGKVGVREVKAIVREGATLATFLGGPLVAAAGLLALAFITNFGRAREELEKTRKKAMETFRDIRAGGDAGRTSTVAGQLFEGVSETDVDVAKFAEAHAVAEEAARLGVRGLQDRMRQLTAIRAAGISAGGAMTETAVRANAELLRLEPLLKTIEARWKAIGGEADRQAREAAGRDAIGNKIRAEGEALEAAAEDAERYAEALAESRLAMQRGFELRAHERIGFAFGEFGLADEITLRVGFDEVAIAEQLKRLGTSTELLNAAQSAADAMNATLAEGVISGLSAAFSGDDVLAGLGSMIMRFGEIIIQFSGFLEVFKASLLSNPIFAGATGFVIGAAMVALGSSLRGAVGGRGGGTSFGRGIGRVEDISRFTLGNQASTASSGMGSQVGHLNPAQPIVFAPTIIGVDDLHAQRQLVAMFDKAAQRGIKPR